MNATSLQVFDIIGRLVETLVDDEMKPGSHKIDWDGSVEIAGNKFFTFYLYQPSDCLEALGLLPNFLLEIYVKVHQIKVLQELILEFGEVAELAEGTGLLNLRRG